jgi:cytoskeletal protein RodZ
MADGIAGATTLNRLDDAIAAQQAAANTEAETAENAEAAAADAQPKNSNRRFWLLGGAVATFILASLGLIILLSAFSKAMQPPQLEAETEDEANSETAPPRSRPPPHQPARATITPTPAPKTTSPNPGLLIIPPQPVNLSPNPNQRAK